MPDYVNVDLLIANVRQDRDNVMKEVHDPLQGIVFPHDSRILDGRTKRQKDKLGPRIEVEVSEVNGKDYGFGKPR